MPAEGKTRCAGTVVRSVSQRFESLQLGVTCFSPAGDNGSACTLYQFLCSLYTKASTVLQVDGQSSGPLVQNRGVKHGDPLSPLLFNCVIDWALWSLDPEMGVVAGEGPRLNHLAFADDVVIICQSSIGCQHLCRQFEKASGRCGLRLNADKSTTLRIAVN